MRGKRAKMDYNLRFMAEVLGVEELHWGYFPEQRFRHAGLPLAELQQAQADYTEHLLGFIPADAGSILDVGCGLGRTARLLKTRGFDVHCLSNDLYQQTMLAQRHPDLPFTKSRFEENTVARRFDLILMSESAQYMDWPAALRKCREQLNPGGYLLLSDYFRLQDDPYYRTCKIRGPFARQTEEASFVLVREEDITDYVLPTLDFGRYYCERYLLPTANILVEMLSDYTRPSVRFLLNLFFRRRISRLEHYVFAKTPQKLDRKLFKEKMCYLIQLWRLAGHM